MQIREIQNIRVHSIGIIECSSSYGIVPKPSQQAWDAVQYEYFIDEQGRGSNHFQVRNDRVAEDYFFRAFRDGDLDPWFRCVRP